MRIGIVGGSFNPPHIGHAAMIQYALALGDFDELLVAPCYKHPFKDKMLSFYNRMYMCNIMVRKLFPHNVMAVDYEKEINTGRTYDLLKFLIADYPDGNYTLILGDDLFFEFDEKWYRSDDIKKLADIMWVPAQLYASNPVLQIRSSYIRHLLREGKDVSRMVPKAVLEYLESRKLMDKLKEAE